MCNNTKNSKIFGLVAVKAESAGILDKIHFGYLVDTSNPYDQDYEQNLCEIEFTDEDIIDDYQLREMILPYMDFSYKK